MREQGIIKTANLNALSWLYDGLKRYVIWLVFLVLVTGLILYKVVFVSTLELDASFWTVYGVIASVYLILRLPYAYLYQDDHSREYADVDYPGVSVIIAAKNEEAGIARTIATCVGSDYPAPIECIVIDDGSTDGTRAEVEKMVATEGDKVRLIVFPQNRGKREAMAAGIRAARHEIVVFVDSDSYLKSDALRHITEHFIDDEKVGAVSGNTKVENDRATLLTRMQSIQYAVSFDIYKAGESLFRTVTCCPGCFSAYRKRAIAPLLDEWKALKFFGSVSTFGDDRGLTNFVLKSWDVLYCEKAQATTIVPESYGVYWRQQLRWKKSWIREGYFASLFMWRKRHPLASFDFYVNFSFPVLGPVLAASVFYRSVVTANPWLFVVFMGGFLLLGSVFALFVRAYRETEHWLHMPMFSFLFVTVFLWQMPYALLTLRKTGWGTR